MAITLLRLLALPLAVLAQQTQELFVDSEPDQEWAASVVNQDACGTTVDLVCTAGTASLPAGYGSISCDPSGFESGFAMASATYSGSSIYEVSQSYDLLRNGGLKVQVTETCSLYPRSTAICSATISASTRGIETLIPQAFTYTGGEASAKFSQQVAITDGTITTGNATCSNPASFATPTITTPEYIQPSRAVASAAGAPKGWKVEVRKVVVVPGAAALVAAAAFV